MKTLKKDAIQAIAKTYGVKSIDLVTFVTRVQNLRKDDIEAELLKFKTQSGVTKSLYKAASEAVSEMFDGEQTKAEKKADKLIKEKDAEQSEKIKKDKKKDKGSKEEKSEKSEKKDKKKSSFTAKYIYPDKMKDSEKKAFRVKARAASAKWEKIIASKEVTDNQKKEYKTWLKETYATAE